MQPGGNTAAEKGGIVVSGRIRPLAIVMAAWLLLVMLPGCGGTSESDVGKMSPTAKRVGTDDRIDFGPYQWRVLAVEKNRALLILENDIGAFPEEKTGCLSLGSNEHYTGTTWKDSAARKHLNTVFYDLFNTREQAHIVMTTNQNPDGSDTKDSIFLLSYEEAARYFSSDDDRQWLFYNQCVFWYLRSPGAVDEGYYAAAVLNDGSLYDEGHIEDPNDGLFRPALWLELDDEDVYTVASGERRKEILGDWEQSARTLYRHFATLTLRADNGFSLTMTELSKEPYAVSGTYGVYGKVVICEITSHAPELKDPYGISMHRFSLFIDGERLLFQPSANSEPIALERPQSSTTSRRIPAAQTITGKWHHPSEGVREENYPALTLRSDNSFTFAVNLYESMSYIEGTYTIIGDTIDCVVASRGFSGFLGDEVGRFQLTISGQNLIYIGDIIGATYPNDLFEPYLI